MNPLQMHELAKDRQATLLAEAAAERLARGGRRFDGEDRPGPFARLLAALRRRSAAIRTRGTAATPRSA